MDIDIALLNTLVFFAFDQGIKKATGSDDWSMLAIFFTYIIEMGLRLLRKKLGERNLTKKTFVDPRFML